MVHRNALRRAVAALPVLPAVLALSACGVMPGGGPPVVTERWDDTHAVARGDAILRDAMLAGHNAARRAVGITPLRWDPALVADAAAYAQELARTRRFAHAPHDPAKVQGENLWMGTRGAYAYQEMIGAWVAERRYYRPGKVPNNSNTGNPADVGHYTQVVWRTTTRVGCATASNASEDYLVCRYTPAGNVVGVAPL